MRVLLDKIESLADVIETVTLKGKGFDDIPLGAHSSQCGVPRSKIHGVKRLFQRDTSVPHALNLRREETKKVPVTIKNSPNHLGLTQIRPLPFGDGIQKPRDAAERGFSYNSP